VVQRQISAVTFSFLACIGYTTTGAHAGWFGPSDYQECILDTMKGRPMYMMETAKHSCEQQFPCVDATHKEEASASLGQCDARTPYPGSGASSEQLLEYGAAGMACRDIMRDTYCPGRD
jgi:hypothetical protein